MPESPKCKICPYKCEKCEEIARERPHIYHSKEESLCGCCLNAVPAKDENGNYITGCSWSIHRRPVIGWEADRGIQSCNDNEYITYGVRHCPEFERG